MKNKGMYRLLSGVLCTSVLLSSQAYAAVPADYSDMPQNWSKEAMAFAVKNNFITGVGENKIAPKAALTRAQLAAILSRVMQTGAGDVSVLAQFKDADTNAWYASALAKAVELKIFYGEGDAIYPDRPVTRQELFTILARAFALTGGNEGTLASYSDAGSISSWAKNAISAMIAQGYAAGYEDKTLRPTQQVTREEFAQLLYRMREHYSSSDTSEDKTETKTDDTAKTDETTKTEGKKTSGGGGGSSSGGSHNSGTVTANKIVDETKATVQTTDMGAWLPLVFADGYDMSKATVTVDGIDVTAAMTPVTTDGTIAKLALTGTPKQVVVAADGKTQTITLNGSGAASVYTGTQYLADYVLAHGAVAAWDYHLTNYDKEGNPRVQPAKTTFDTKDEVNTHPYYAPDAVIAEDDAAENVYKVSGAVTIMFNYNTEAEKAWFDGIGNTVTLVANDGRYDSLGTLEMTKEADVAHGNGKVGVLTIPVGQANFFSNGRYYVRVKSTGGDQATTLVPIHLVNETAPVFKVKETATSGVNLHFSVENMTYGITNPVERVTLTDPTGATKTLRSIDDYYLFGNLFVLYNDVTAENGVNNIPYNGTYTMTVYSNGFKTVSKKFYVSGGENAPTKQAVAVYQSAAYDVVTHATGGSSSGGSSSDGSDSYMVSANLLFKSDLLVNALVLDKLGKATAASDKVVEDWYNMSGYDSLLNKGEVETYYKWDGYLDAVNDIKAEKNDAAAWLPFAEYVKGASAETDPNRPYAVKEVLEDGLLGDVQHSDTYGRKEAPEVTVERAAQGEAVVLKFANKDHFDKVENLFINGNWQELSTEKYSKDEENLTITIAADCFKIGENTVGIDATGYVSKSVKVDYAKVNEENLSLKVEEPVKDTTETDERYTVTVIVDGSEGDFLKNLQSIVLTDEYNEEHKLLDAISGGTTSAYYVIADDYKSITLHNVKPGTYNLEIKAEYYEDALTKDFAITRETALKTAPTVQKQQKLADAKYRLTFTGMDENALDTYLKAIKTVKTADDKEINYSVNAVDTSQSINRDCLDLTGVAAGTEIIVIAEGYQPLKYTLLADAEETAKAAPEVFNVLHQEKNEYSSDTVDHYRVSFKGMTDSELNTYLDAISEVTVNGKAYSPVGNSYPYALKNDMYKVDGSSYSYHEYLDLADNGFAETGTTTITVKANGYADLTITYDAANPIKADVPEVSAVVYKEKQGYSDSKNYYRFILKEMDDNGRYKYLNALKTLDDVTVTVDGTAYSKATYGLDEKNFRVGRTNGITSYDYNYLDLAEDAFPETGTVEIKINVPGYKEFTYNCDVKHLPVATAPTAEVTKTDDGNYRMTFEGMDADTLKAYLKEISSVTVGEQKYEEAGYSLSENRYLLADSNSKYGSNYDCIDFDATGFATDAATTITIKADGYADLEFTYTPADSGGNGGTDTPETPDNGGITVKECKLKNDWNGKFYEMRFNGFDNENDLASFVNSITEVQVGNDKKFTKPTFSFSFSETEFGTVTENYSVGIKFYESSLADVEDGTTITIKGKVNGKDVTITYSLVKE